MSRKAKIEHICKRTGISQEYGEKFLDACYGDEVEAVITIKNLKRRRRNEPRREVTLVTYDKKLEDLKSKKREVKVIDKTKEKINYICRNTRLPEEKAKYFLDKSNNNEIDAVIKFSKILDYICNKTGLYPEEAGIFFKKNDFDKYKAVRNFKGILDEKVDFISNGRKISKKRATRALFINEIDEKKALEYILKKNSKENLKIDKKSKLIIEEKIDYICEKTNLPGKEAKKILLKNNYNEIKAIGSIYHYKFEPESMENKPPSEDIDRSLESIISVEVGNDIIPLIMREKGAPLLNRAYSIRKYMAGETGMLIPPIRFKSNKMFSHDSYLIKIKDHIALEGKIVANKFIALGDEDKVKQFDGIKSVELICNIHGVWIEAGLRSKAEKVGLMIFSPLDLISSNIAGIIKKYSYKIINCNIVKVLLELQKKKKPVIIEEIYPKLLSIEELTEILKTLLKEDISIKNMIGILEAISDYLCLNLNKDPVIISEYIKDNL